MSTLSAAIPHAPSSDPTTPITVTPWPSERPLFVLALAVSALLYLLAVLSIVGLIYGIVLGVFFFILHVSFIAHVRGNGVRICEDQFPELHDRVRTLATRMGMPRAPEAYLLQAGGTLNAFATRFLGANIIVLFSDLLEACGENEAARDMIIAHELGHLRAGHVRWHWLTLPARLIPFLGTALSRAREYTCDRYGLAGAGDREGALLGLTVLAVGGRHASRVNQRAFVRQQSDLNTGWMTIGQWLSTHPPLAKRLAALDPRLAEQGVPSNSGRNRALAILLACMAISGSMSVFALAWLPSFVDEFASAAALDYEVPANAEELAAAGFAQMRTFIEAEIAAGRPAPYDADDLYARWSEANPGVEPPVDPYDGFYFDFQIRPWGYILRSIGPDQMLETSDDLVLVIPRSPDSP